MKILKSKAVIPLIFIAYGLFYFFEPTISAWFEIVDSSIAATIFLPIHWVLTILLLPIYAIFSSITNNKYPFTISYIADFLFLLTYLIYLIYFIIVRKVWTKKQKRLALIPIVVFPLLWFILLPIGMTNIDRHVNSFSIGGWSRLLFAGGSEIVTKDGLKLLETPKQDYPDYDELPSSIKKLGGWVKIEQDKKLVLVGIGTMFNMADEFGFIIQKDNGATLSQIPHYLEESGFYRVWKLTNNIYFFEH